MGLYEGLLGNSGVASSDSTAPSYYNPSLLSRKKGDSYNLSASSIGAFVSRTETQNLSAFSFTPNYLSSIMIGTALNHEIFIHTSIPSRLSTTGHEVTATTVSNLKLEADYRVFNFGYSMAFRSFPFALSYITELTNNDFILFSDFEDNSDGTRFTSYGKNKFQSLSLILSASGHFNINSYSMGYNFKTRRLPLYKKSEGEGDSYFYNPASSTPYTKTHFDGVNVYFDVPGQSLLIGHGFKVGDHEFLTDSVLQESSKLSHTYDLTQSFGYRMNSASGHQFLCGINHLINPEIKYFGQSAYYSVGYSWLTRSLRSAIGAYYYSSKFNQDVFAAGLSFGSEFSY